MILRKSAAAAAAPIVELEPEILIDPSQPRTYASSLRQVGSGAISVVAGTGGIGALLTKQAVVLTKKGIDKARQSGVDIAALAAVEDAPAEKTGGSRLRRRLIIGGTLAATLATGAAVFRWSRQRNAAPPVADAPPTLGPSANGSTPAKTSSAEVAH